MYGNAFIIIYDFYCWMNFSFHIYNFKVKWQYELNWISQCSAEEERGETGLRRCGLRREQLGLEPPLPHHHHHHYHQQDHHHHLLLSLPNTSTVSWRRPSTTLPHLLPISVIWSDLLSTSYWFLTYQLHCKQQSFLSRGKTPHLTFHCFFILWL